MIICAIGTTEIILIAAVVLLIFGGKKIPELMRGLGQGVRQFKDGMREPQESDQELGTAISKDQIREERLAKKRKQLEDEGIQPLESIVDNSEADSANPKLSSKEIQ